MGAPGERGEQGPRKTRQPPPDIEPELRAKEAWRPSSQELEGREERRLERDSLSMNNLAPRLFWLIAKVEAGRMGFLTTNLAEGEKALPVFSFQDEARMFLELGASRGGWRVRVTTVGELVSILFGPCAGVGRVLLDPLPGVDGRVSADLVGMGRESFVEYLLSRRTRWPVPCERTVRSMKPPIRAVAWEESRSRPIKARAANERSS